MFDEPLARQVHTAELGDGVVPVLDEDALEELLGPPGAGVAGRAAEARRLQAARPRNSSRKRRRSDLGERE